MIGYLEGVSEISSTSDQLGKTVDVLGNVVAVPDEVTDDSKVSSVPLPSGVSA